MAPSFYLSGRETFDQDVQAGRDIKLVGMRPEHSIIEWPLGTADANSMLQLPVIMLSERDLMH